MDIYTALSLLCGLAFFLFGMSVMSANLEKLAGGSLEEKLKKVTSNKFLSLIIGIVITAIMQSSSGMTVMLVGLCNSGILAFSDTISMILGTNVGTTLTGWILTLMGISTDEFSIMSLASPKCFVPILAFVGALLRLFSKKEKRKDIGTILLGFSVLMYGMSILSDGCGSLAELPQFKNLLVQFSNPIILLLIAAVFTGIIQSSGAAIGIFQAFALNGILNYSMAVPMVLGANIGTTVTALITSIGANKDSKRVVTTHILINVIGSILSMGLLYGITPILGIDLQSIPANAVSIAIIHTVFNLFNVVIFFPLQSLLVKVIEKLIPDDGTKTKFLDDRLLAHPSVAVNECVSITNEMAYVAEEAVLKACSLIAHYSDDVAQTIEKDENELDRFEDEMGAFLVKLSKISLSDDDTHKVAKIQHALVNLERMGDHALNIHDLIIDERKRGFDLSQQAVEEIKLITKALAEILDLTMYSFIHDDLGYATKVEPLEETIDRLVAQAQDNHVQRLAAGKCTLENGFVVNDLLGNIERISDHCSNIAVTTIELKESKYKTHSYINMIRHESKEYIEQFNTYAKKYNIEQEKN